MANLWLGTGPGPGGGRPGPQPLISRMMLLISRLTLLLDRLVPLVIGLMPTFFIFTTHFLVLIDCVHQVNNMYGVECWGGVPPQNAGQATTTRILVGVVAPPQPGQHHEHCEHPWRCQLSQYNHYIRDGCDSIDNPGVSTANDRRHTMSSAVTSCQDHNLAIFLTH